MGCFSTNRIAPEVFTQPGPKAAVDAKQWLWGSYRPIFVFVEVRLMRVLPPAMMVTFDQLDFFQNEIFLSKSWPFS